jgi:hypothetical protein
MDFLKVIILTSGLTLVGLECLFPRWGPVVTYGQNPPAIRQFVFSPAPVSPGNEYRIDTVTLAMEVCITLSVAAVLFMLADFAHKRVKAAGG